MNVMTMCNRFSSFLCLFVLALATYSANAQVINAYAEVTAISGSVLTLSNVNETFHTFAAGDEVIIMQMQDNVIGGTSDNSSFGSLGSIGSAGLYEVRVISSRTATSLTLSNPPSNTYTIGTNSSVQVISFTLLGSPDYTTTADMAALDWNGHVGGVIAFKVRGILTLNHNITANGAGFVGGSVSANNGTVDCQSTWRTSSSSLGGEKGESIYKRTDVNYQYGRGNILNGGGGGNRHNAGGGGGGNFTAGGDGGAGFQCTGTPVGGHGGLALGSQITTSRIFMGGGGGGGHQNNSLGSSGADGGGIILISATQIITTGSCTGRTISANGASASNSNNDGSGGGGAGGTIVIDAQTFSVVSGCPLTVSANGGNGGTVLDAASHGGGGGGGQGKVFYSFASPANTTTSTTNGTSGCNNNSSPCTDQASAASGTSNAGISTSVGGTPLPVSLLYFRALCSPNGAIELEWKTASEHNNEYFTISKSSDGSRFSLVTTVAGHATTDSENTYLYEDTTIHGGTYYYRLSQIDFDGTEKDLKIIVVECDQGNNTLTVYPVPMEKGGSFFINQRSVPLQIDEVKLFNMFGREVSSLEPVSKNSDHDLEFYVPDVPPGFYILKVTSATHIIVKEKVIIR